MLEVARHAEARGLDSLWVTDHVIVPNETNVIYREDMLDPLAVLPWLAGVTSRIALGTSVVILPYRSPIPVAKLLASVDVLSGGRLLVGAAIGWLEGEFEALGVPFKERVSRSEEALELFRTLWTEEHPKLETRRHRLHDVTVSPMPLQKPRPPLYVGGGSEGALRRVARLGDGWHATSSTVEQFRQGVDTVRGFWKEAGRGGDARGVAAHPDHDRRRAPTRGGHGLPARPSRDRRLGGPDHRGTARLPRRRLRAHRAGGLVLDLSDDPRRRSTSSPSGCGLTSPTEVARRSVLRGGALLALSDRCSSLASPAAATGADAGRRRPNPRTACARFACCSCTPRIVSPRRSSRRTRRFATRCSPAGQARWPSTPNIWNSCAGPARSRAS